MVIISSKNDFCINHEITMNENFSFVISLIFDY